MAIDHVRHGRQVRLLEIGEAGQERLQAIEVVARAAGDAQAIEVDYLKRAGVGVAETTAAKKAGKAKAAAKPKPVAAPAPPPELDADALAHAKALAALGVRDSEVREVADGALWALVTMRRVLGLDGNGGAG